ncbi:hypothetical protein ABVN64_30305 [Mycolicibacterium conceptionense]|uniref:hypothetical protein n=1 Tax=Mycolicibacterium conceptionense TaxID=451644 RepID=UPI00336B3D84
MSEFPTLAEVVAKHADFWIGGDSPHRSCTCGWTDYGPHAQVSREQFAEHVREAWMDACTITTVEQLRAISPTPESLSGALIKSFGDGLGGVLELNDDGTWNDYDRADGEHIDASEVHLPALLIWHPDWSKA